MSTEEDLAEALAHIKRLEQELMDHAEDWAMAGIHPRSELAKKLAAHYHQRAREREQLRRCRQVMEANDPGNARDIFGDPAMT